MESREHEVVGWVHVYIYRKHTIIGEVLNRRAAIILLLSQYKRVWIGIAVKYTERYATHHHNIHVPVVTFAAGKVAVVHITEVLFSDRLYIRRTFNLLEYHDISINIYQRLGKKFTPFCKVLIRIVLPVIIDVGIVIVIHKMLHIPCHYR